MVNQFDAEAKRVCALIAPGPRLVVIGSASFRGADSRSLCEAVAADLAAYAPLVALTGGRGGVGLTFGRAIAESRQAVGLPENLYHLLPRGFGPCDSGVTLAAGVDFHERREVLGRIGDAYLIIEGGPGTEHEASVATSRGVPVIALGRTGGYARELHLRMCHAPRGLPCDWDLIGDADAQHNLVVDAVGRLVRAALDGHDNPGAASERP